MMASFTNHCVATVLFLKNICQRFPLSSNNSIGQQLVAQLGRAFMIVLKVKPYLADCLCMECSGKPFALTRNSRLVENRLNTPTKPMPSMLKLSGLFCAFNLPRDITDDVVSTDIMALPQEVHS